MRQAIITKHDDKKQLYKWGYKLSQVKDFGGFHNIRVAEISYLLSKKLGINKLNQEKIYTGSLVHDIGKVLIPKRILKKNTKLEKEEMEIVKNHPEMGLKILEIKDPIIKNIILYHHERFDGNGYPFGLKGDEIPIESQIVLICDIYDALRSDRPYKKIFTHKESIKIIEYGDDVTTPDFYDEKILKYFLEMKKIIQKVYYNFDLSK